MIFKYVVNLGSKLMLGFLICQKQTKSLFSPLPYTNIEGRENNVKRLVWWIRGAIERQSSSCISTETLAGKMCNWICFVDLRNQEHSLAL